MILLTFIHSPPRTPAKHSRHLRSPITGRLRIFVKRHPSRLLSFARSVRLLSGCARICNKYRIKQGSERSYPVNFMAKTDKFINLPTGFCKSWSIKLCRLFPTQSVELLDIIVVVVSPLVNPMKDQATKLASIGIPAVMLSDISEKNMRVVERGAFSVAYGSPAAWMNIDRWRKC